jgi:hypothetical protein
LIEGLLLHLRFGAEAPFAVGLLAADMFDEQQKRFALPLLKGRRRGAVAARQQHRQLRLPGRTATRGFGLGQRD